MQGSLSLSQRFHLVKGNVSVRAGDAGTSAGLGGGEELGLGETIPPRGEECAKKGENRKYRK